MSVRTAFLVVTLAVGLTVLFWAPLWQGGGLIGGDLYPYFFPQKVAYADQLADGRLPLWNRLVGFGYPLLAESQTGVLYPPNPLLYRLLSVNTAYNASQLAHYVLAFIFTWLLMRRLDLTTWGAILAAVVFVYGWFPPRICLEWAIIGGAYLPLCLWCVESFLQTGRRAWLAVLAGALGVHLLVGHFNLAFITQLTVVGYTVLRLILSRESLNSSLRNGQAWRRGLLPVTLAVACGFTLAAVQLLPTWQLKQLSQRDEVGAHHDPGYGHIPPWYLSQIVAPWMWYVEESDPDQALNSIKALSIPSATNKVEAHLYFGLVPLLLAAYRLLLALWGSEPLDRRHLALLLLGLAAMVYATGWLLPLTRHLPGFSFFMGPGRYGIVTTLAVGLLAGAGLDQLLSRGRARHGRATLPQGRAQGHAPPPGRLGRSLALPGLGPFVVIVVLGLTLADLYWVCRRDYWFSEGEAHAVTYAVMVTDPPIEHRDQSEVARLLREYEQNGPELSPVRVWAPGANVFTLTGFAATPVYLGLGPAAYFDSQATMPEPTPDASSGDRAATRNAQKQWLRWAAVTHILRMEPLDRTEWPQANLVWQGIDRLLNPIWGRFQQPLFLYELAQPGPYAQWEPVSAGDRVTVSAVRDGSIVLKTSTADDGAMLTIAELNYPGWSVTIDGAEQGGPAAGEFLAVGLPAGNHEVQWRFSPPILWWGAGVSLIGWSGLLFWTGATIIRRRCKPLRGTDDVVPPAG